jgi:Tol biopolymer transport system component
VGGRASLGCVVFQQDLDPVEDEVDYDLFTMEADGTHQRNLTRSPGIQDENADWSPTGHRIAFGSDRDANPELYTMCADGSDQTRLTFNEASDFLSTWSPDGRRLAFTTDRDGNVEVYTMRADGSQQVNRTQNPAFDFDPDWQPLP